MSESLTPMFDKLGDAEKTAVHVMMNKELLAGEIYDPADLHLPHIIEGTTLKYLANQAAAQVAGGVVRVGGLAAAPSQEAVVRR